MRSRLAALALAAGLGGGCAEELSEPLPAAPDMEGLVLDYETPTADLDADLAQVALEEAIASVDLETLEEGLRGLVDTVEVAFAGGSQPEAAKADGAGEKGDAAIGLAETLGELFTEAEGFVVIRRICSGWEGGTTPDAEGDGTLELTLVATLDGVVPVVWGTATACRYLAGSLQVAIDGEVRVHIGEALSSSDTLDTGFVLQVLGDLRLGELELTGDVDVRVTTGGRIEQRLFLGEGGALGHVIRFVEPATESFGFRAANGTWGCDPTEKTCGEIEGP